MTIGKIKGGSFERSVCRALSLWVSEGKDINLFWRSAMSGGRATIQYKKGEINRQQSGDISAISAEGIELINSYYIECKFYKDLRIDSSILTGRGDLIKFWKETKRQAHRYQKVAVLVAKQNRLPTMLWTEMQCGLFGPPLIVIPSWGAKCYLFDQVVKVSKKIGRVKL